MEFIESVVNGCLELNNIIKNKDLELFESLGSGFGGDISKRIDIVAEVIFVKYLSSYGQIYSEESGYIGEANSCLIYLDPLDGSDNFISQIPYFGVSVARECGGKIAESVVCNLANGDIFIKSKELSGAFKLNNPLEKNIFLSNIKSTVGIFEKGYKYPYIGEKLIERGYKYRTLGAIALSLAYAPYVKYVLFLGTIRLYDIVAGLELNSHLLIAKEDNYILISSDIEIFNDINEIVKRSLLESI